MLYGFTIAYFLTAITLERQTDERRKRARLRIGVSEYTNGWTVDRDRFAQC